MSGLCLFSLAACTSKPEIIDDADFVSVDYTYTCQDEVVENGNASFVIWENSKYSWMESIVLWAEKDAAFSWRVLWDTLFPGEYDSDKLQIYPNIIMNEVLWLDDPQIWDKVEVSSVWEGKITGIYENEQWYLEYLVDFNEPKTYSDIIYFIQVTDIEKR